MANEILSREFVLKYDGQLIARCKDYSLEINKETIDVTSLESVGWKEKLVDIKEWSNSFSGLVARVTTGEVEISDSYWKAGTTYADLAEVVFGGKIYISDVAGNVGNNPAEDDGTNWDLKADYAAGTTYANDDIVIESGIIYISQQASNTGNTPSTDDGTYWVAAKIFFSYLLNELIGSDTAVEVAYFLDDSKYIYGNAILTGLTLSGSVGDVAGFDGSLEGTGELTAPSGFDPSDLSGLELWLEADTGVTTAGGAVSDWDDQSTNDYDATQATGADQPVNTLSALNSKPIIEFDGTTDDLDIDSGINTKINTSSDFTIFAVAKRDVAIAGTESILTLISASADRIGITMWGTSTIIGSSAYDGTVLNAGSSDVIAENTFYTIAIKYNAVGRTLSMYVNGVLQSGISAAALASTPGYKIGALTTGIQFLDGAVAAIIACSSELSDSDRDNVESYLKSKYNHY